MSIPLNTFTVIPVHSQFMAPASDAYQAMIMRATGGTAIGDGSAGREIQLWTVKYEGTNINVYNALGVLSFTMVIPGVTSVCLAFDSNMAVTICYTKSDGSYLYFFNSQSGQFETLFLIGVGACRVAVDKTSLFFNTNSDVLFVYSKAGVLYWRQQRDRYTIERTVGPITAGQTLRRVGPNVENRLQIEMST